MDENKNFDKIDELLESTSSENRIRFNIADVESTDVALEDRFGAAPEVEEEEMPSPTVEVAPVEEELVEEFVEEEPVAAPAMVIVDETATVISDDEPVKTEEPKKAKKKMKFNALQIIIIAVVAIATLWTVIYTVDHTLAAQGYSPAFSISSTSYDDGSVSYKCLGYKVQFMYDSNDNLTQKCVPFWEDGPNDIRFNQGLLFEVQE